jgi:hypothetical protein
MFGDHICTFLHLQVILVVMRPQLALVPLLFILAHVPITQANIRFMGGLAFSFTLTMPRVLSSMHSTIFMKLWQMFRNVHLLVEDLSNLSFQSMKEGQLLGKLSIKRDDSQLCVEVLHIMGQWICFVPLGKLQELHPLL